MITFASMSSIPGVPMDIFVIRESVVVPYIQDAYFDHQLPVLPPHVDLVSLTWQAKDGEVSQQSISSSHVREDITIERSYGRSYLSPVCPV